MNALEVPDPFAGGSVESQQSIGKQIVANRGHNRNNPIQPSR